MSCNLLPRLAFWQALWEARVLRVGLERAHDPIPQHDVPARVDMGHGVGLVAQRHGPHAVECVGPGLQNDEGATQRGSELVGAARGLLAIVGVGDHVVGVVSPHSEDWDAGEVLAVK